MSAFARAIIAGRHQRVLQLALFAALACLLLAIGYGFVRWQISSHVAREQRSELKRITLTHDNASKALSLLNAESSAGDCNEAILSRMREVAFLPDGLNEFIYAPGGIAQCSTSHSSLPANVRLGPPDIYQGAPTNLTLRLNRNLAPLGRPGTISTIAQLGDFAVALPPHEQSEEGQKWMLRELVAKGAQGQHWNVAGNRGLYARNNHASRYSLLDWLTYDRATLCEKTDVYCAAARADILRWASEWTTILASVVVLTCFFAWLSARNLLGVIRRYWSLEERFRRRLNADAVVAAYQPLFDVHANEIVGCEVLARWRDADGSIVQPKDFIDFVPRLGITAEFTQMVVDRAWEELSRNIPDGKTLHINFNVFANDFEITRLLRIFAKFLQDPQRFRVGVELVEHHDIDLHKAQETIQELSAAGIDFYIDDFGTGYSSIERVARLKAHGVKLDRSFAMSSPDSVLGRMLLQVIEMIRTSGHCIIVEGVETHARLKLLRDSGMVDWVQGYVIAPPLDIAAFVDLLTQRGSGTTGARRPAS
jgi:sensor c-di-GMP phosphodiesterase-like protein